jgi:hypothetical protein
MIAFKESAQKKLLGEILLIRSAVWFQLHIGILDQKHIILHLSFESHICYIGIISHAHLLSESNVCQEKSVTICMNGKTLKIVNTTQNLVSEQALRN